MNDAPPTLRFDRFEFRPLSGELRREDGVLVRLEPQPARVLALLVERAGELVTREELQREVWPDGTFVDFDRGLNYCIAKIRAALGDSATAGRFVETLPRRGYRFLAAVSPLPIEKTPNRRVPPPWWGRTGAGAVVTAIVVALIVVLGAAWFGFWRQALPAIAVARFDNETGRAALDRQAQTLTDSIVERLTHPPGRWSVIGNAAILRVPRSFRDLEAIAAALEVDLILLGQLQESDGRLRVLVHLIRARDQKHLWAQRFPMEEAGWESLEARVVSAVRAAVLENVTTGP